MSSPEHRTPSAATTALREWMKQARADGFAYCCETAEENGLTYEVLDRLLAEHARLRTALDEISAETSGVATSDPGAFNRFVAVLAALEAVKDVG